MMISPTSWDFEYTLHYMARLAETASVWDQFSENNKKVKLSY